MQLLYGTFTSLGYGKRLFWEVDFLCLFGLPLHPTEPHVFGFVSVNSGL